LIAAETRERKYVNTPQPKTCDYFSKLAWRSHVRNLLSDFSFQHLEPAILNTSLPFTPHGGCRRRTEVRPKVIKSAPPAAEVRGSCLLKHLRPDSGLV